MVFYSFYMKYVLFCSHNIHISDIYFYWADEKLESILNRKERITHLCTTDGNIQIPIHRNSSDTRRMAIQHLHGFFREPSGKPTCLFDHPYGACQVGRSGDQMRTISIQTDTSHYV